MRDRGHVNEGVISGSMNQGYRVVANEVANPLLVCMRFRAPSSLIPSGTHSVPDLRRERGNQVRTRAYFVDLRRDQDLSTWKWVVVVTLLSGGIWQQTQSAFRRSQSS